MKKSALEYQKYLSFLLSEPNYLSQYEMRHPVHILCDSIPTKHVICIMKLIVRDPAAYRANALTAGISDKAPRKNAVACKRT